MIDKQIFRTWQHDVVTKEVIKKIKDKREHIESVILNSAILMENGSDKEIGRLFGYRECIDYILDIENVLEFEEEE